MKVHKDFECPKCKSLVGNVCYRMYNKGSGSPIRIPELYYCPDCKTFLTLTLKKIKVIEEKEMEVLEEL